MTDGGTVGRHGNDWKARKRGIPEEHVGKEKGAASGR